MLPADATADAIARSLERDGYAIVERFVEAGEVARIRGELTEILATVPTGRNPFEGLKTRRIYAIFAKTRALDALAVHPVVLGVLDRVLGHYQLSAPVAIQIGPGEAAQVLHRDDGVYPVADPRDELVLNIMYAIDDFTADNGGTRVAPGTHRGAIKGPSPDTPVVSVEMPAGSAMFYVGSLWHGGGANRTDSPRLGVAMEYVVSWLRQQENQLVAVPREVVKTLPPRLQELLGYNVRPPFLGYVDGRHPLRTLNSD